MDAPEGRRGAVSVSRPVLAGAKPSNSSGMKGLISQNNNGDKTGQAPVRRQALRHRREHPGHRGSRQPFARPRAKPAGAQGPRPPRNKLPTPHHGAASTSGQGRGKGLSFHRGDPLCARLTSRPGLPGVSGGRQGTQPRGSCTAVSLSTQGRRRSASACRGHPAPSKPTRVHSGAGICHTRSREPRWGLQGRLLPFKGF